MKNNILHILTFLKTYITYKTIPLTHKFVMLTFYSSLNICEKPKINRNVEEKSAGKLSDTNTFVNCKGESYNKVRKIKHFPPANKEWINSIYTYNSSAEKALPNLDKNLALLVKSFFNLHSNKLKKNVAKLKSRRIEVIKARRSVKNILVSNSELKHTNDKVIITVYVYNSEKKYYLNKMKKISDVFNPKLDISYEIRNIKKISLNLKSKLQKLSLNVYSLTANKKFKLDKNTRLNIDKHRKIYIKSFVRKFLRKEIISMYFKQLLAFNKMKFEKRRIFVLNNQIKKLYNKNVEFNFITLKYPYFNDHIFSTVLITKIKNLSRVKRNFMIAIKKSLNMLNIPAIKSQDIYDDMYNKEMVYENLNISNLSSNSFGKKSDILDISPISHLSNLNPSDNTDTTENLSRLIQVFKLTKNKFLNGVRIEIAGRLTRRSKAVRSIFKIRNKGNIRNKDSSDKGLSTVMLRGYAKSNLQYKKLYSKVRGGSFGLKGKVSSN